MAVPRRVLIVNPASGRGRAQRLDLVGHCRARGIETVIRQAGDDISELARTALAGGAEMLGMAGGDGSQAAVAAVAAEYDVPYVCVPAGTRNHFALDVGVDRNDVIGALEAFSDGTERRIDLARVNNRVFVNNASMGLYGRIVQSREYRDAKLRTVIEKLPDLVGPAAERFDLRFTGPDGREHPDAALLLVSNNPYLFDPRPGQRNPRRNRRRNPRCRLLDERTSLAGGAGVGHARLPGRVRQGGRGRAGWRSDRHGSAARLRVPAIGSPDPGAGTIGRRQPPGRCADPPLCPTAPGVLATGEHSPVLLRDGGCRFGSATRVELGVEPLPTLRLAPPYDPPGLCRSPRPPRLGERLVHGPATQCHPVFLGCHRFEEACTVADGLARHPATHGHEEGDGELGVPVDRGVRVDLEIRRTANARRGRRGCTFGSGRPPWPWPARRSWR